MDIWKPNSFHANKTLFLQRDPQTVEGILVSLTPDDVLSFMSVPILWPSAKQSIELSNDIFVIPCCENMQCKRGFLPWVFKLTELIFLKLTIYLKQAITSLIKLPFLSVYQTH
jgi:hypothetical protein